MVPHLWAGTFVGYKAKNQQKIWDDNRIFVRRDVIFNEFRFQYKDKPSRKPVGDNTSADLITLVSMLYSVEKDNCIGSILQINQIEPHYLNTPKPQNDSNLLPNKNIPELKYKQ